MRLPKPILLLASALACGGCADAARGVPAWEGGPRLHPLASVTFQQRDSFIVTAPRSMAVDRATGDFLLADPRSRHVVRFDRTGAPVRLYTSRGVGEQIGHTSVVAALPARVVVADMVRGRLHHLDARTASLLRSDVLPGDVGTVFSQPGPELWIGTHFRGATEASPKGAVLMPLDGGTQVRLQLPEEYFRLPGLKIHSGMGVVRRRDDLVVGFSALEALLRVTTDGRARDTLLVPVRARRGVRAHRVEGHGGDTHELVNRASRLALLDQTSAGEIVLVHFDSRYLRSGRLQTAIYVSLLSPDLRRACVDGVLDAPSLQVPNAVFSADTLWVQTSDVHDGRARYTATAWRVDASGCEWLPVTAGSSFLLP